MPADSLNTTLQNTAPQAADTSVAKQRTQGSDTLHTEGQTPSEFVVLTEADYARMDSVWKWRHSGPDTFFLTSKDLPVAIMDTAYMDSLKTAETVTPPKMLTPPLRTPVSEEEETYNHIYENLTDFEKLAQRPALHHHVEAEERYPGMEGTALRERLPQSLWFLPLMVAMFFAYGTIFSSHGKSLGNELKKFFRPHTHRNINEESATAKWQYKLILLALGIISSALFAAMALPSFTTLPVAVGLRQVAACAVVLSIYLLTKELATAYLSFVFFSPHVRKQWCEAHHLIVQVCGFILFAAVVCMAFGISPLAKAAMWTGIGASALAELMLIAYDLSRFLRPNLSILYLILYLCTLEIIPTIMLVAGYFYALGMI